MGAVRHMDVKLGRLEITMSRWTMGVGLIGFLWLMLSAGFVEAVLRWAAIGQWREDCRREGGTFTVDNERMTCAYPNGASKSMIWTKPAL
jgi:hypothetical protein